MDDQLRAMASQAVADDKQRRMHLYIDAVNWVLDQRSASDLPAGSVVASTQQVWIKDHPDSDHQWSCSDGCPSDDAEIDRYLALDLQVLRVGTGED